MGVRKVKGKGATISLSAAMPDDPTKRSAAFAGPAEGPNETDENGRVTIGPVLTNRELLICANHDDYLGGCAEKFTMKESLKSIRLELAKALKLRGRVIAGVPFDAQNPALFWCSAVGEITESVRKFAPDGTFTYTKPHLEGETVVFLSSVTPLYAFMQPSVDGNDVFEITVPAARTRSFSVSLARTSAMSAGGSVSLKVGDVFISATMLMQQMVRRRGGAIVLRPGDIVQVPDILETGPISAILIPFRSVAVPPGAPRDPLFGPERNSLPRKQLGDGDAIVFE